MKYIPLVTMLGRLAALVTLTTLGCGISTPAVSGIANVTLHRAGKADSSPTPWFGGTDISLDAPPGRAQGFFGTCTYAGATWTADIHRAGTSIGAIHAMRLTVPDGVAQASITIAVDQGTFAGNCTVAAGRWSDSHDLRIAGDCMDLTLQSDPSTADATLAMSVTNCTGP